MGNARPIVRILLPGLARLGDQHSQHSLHHRQRSWPASLPRSLVAKPSGSPFAWVQLKIAVLQGNTTVHKANMFPKVLFAYVCIGLGLSMCVSCCFGVLV